MCLAHSGLLASQTTENNSKRVLPLPCSALKPTCCFTHARHRLAGACPALWPASQQKAGLHNLPCTAWQKRATPVTAAAALLAHMECTAMLLDG